MVDLGLCHSEAIYKTLMSAQEATLMIENMSEVISYPRTYIAPIYIASVVNRRRFNAEWRIQSILKVSQYAHPGFSSQSVEREANHRKANLRLMKGKHRVPWCKLVQQLMPINCCVEVSWSTGSCVLSRCNS